MLNGWLWPCLDYKTRSEDQISLICTASNDIKIELEIRKEVLIKNLTALVEDFEELCIIEEQLIFINKNLITVRTALDYHETKITEHRLGLNDLYLISLN